MRWQWRRLHGFVAILCAAFGCSLNFDVGPAVNGNPDGGTLTPNGNDGAVDEGGIIAPDGNAPDVGPEQPPPIAFEQPGFFDSGNASVKTFNLPLDAPMKAGHLMVILVAIETNSTTSVLSITDGTSNSYVTSDARSTNGGCNDRLEIWHATNVAPGATSIAVTMSSSVLVAAAALEFSGLSKTAPRAMGKATNDGASSQLITAPSISPSTPKALIVSAAQSCENITGRFPGSDPFTSIGLHDDEAAGYLITSEARAYQAAWATDPSSTWNSSSVLFTQ